MKSRKPDNPMPETPVRDPDFAGAEAAMRRAAESARRRATDSGGSFALFKDGKIIWVKADGKESL